MLALRTHFRSLTRWRSAQRCLLCIQVSQSKAYILHPYGPGAVARWPWCLRAHQLCCLSHCHAFLYNVPALCCKTSAGCILCYSFGLPHARNLRATLVAVMPCVSVRVCHDLLAVVGMPMSNERMANEAQCNALARCGQLVKVTAIALNSSEYHTHGILQTQVLAPQATRSQLQLYLYAHNSDCTCTCVCY